MLAALLLACCTAHEAPPAAVQLLDEIKAAADTRDYEVLRSHMQEDFIWSFGGDSSADQAIEAWAGDASYLSELITAIEAGCVHEPPRVRCPKQETLGFRAGVIQVNGTWRFEYFVAGD